MVDDRFFASLIRKLGVPDYETQGIALYNRDCLTGMKTLPPGCINLTVTSPPYNIGKEYEAKVETNHFLSWCTEWISAIYDATCDEGAFWLNLGYVSLHGRARAIPLPYLLWNRIPFFLMQEVVWHYGAGVAARKAFSPRNEKFLWYVKDEERYVFNLDDVRDPDVKYPYQKKNGKLKCNPNGKNPSDVWIVPKVTSGANRSSPERTAHPAQFPIEVIERIILATSNPGDTILDPFMGSGTTALVARRLDRRVIGFELSAEYMDLAAKRLSNEFEKQQIIESQVQLFDCGI